VALDDPKLNVLTLSIGIGAFRKIEDFGGGAVAFFFSPALTLGNSFTVAFGPTGTPVVISGFNGVYIRLGAPVSEITITNTGAGALNGQMIASPCAQFLVLGM